MGGRVVGLQDGGASSVVCGHEAMMDILDGFVKKGVNANEFLFSKTYKSFLWRGPFDCCGLVCPPSRSDGW